MGRARDMRVLIRWEHVKKNKNLRFLMVAPDFMGKTMEKQWKNHGKNMFFFSCLCNESFRSLE